MFFQCLEVHAINIRGGKECHEEHTKPLNLESRGNPRKYLRPGFHQELQILLGGFGGARPITNEGPCLSYCSNMYSNTRCICVLIGQLSVKLSKCGLSCAPAATLHAYLECIIPTAIDSQPKRVGSYHSTGLIIWLSECS